jgi:HlyD family secretion protein
MSIAGSKLSEKRLPRVRWTRLAWPLVGLTIVGAVAWGAMYWLRGRTDDGASRLVTKTITRGEFQHNVVEPGELESSNNVEVRCEVQARNSAGTVILEIVPNGTEVQPGDFLIRFDSSALEQEHTQQQIEVNNAKALVIQSKNLHETAIIAKQEYLEGTFVQEEQLLLGELFVAEEALRRADEYARYSERLAAKGYVTSEQVEADKFAVEKARNDVAAVETKLKVLREFTKAKMVKQLDADIQTTQAKLESDEHILKLAEEKLALIDSQIKKCVVTSPAAGKVVYANKSDRRGGTEIVIEEGAIIRERQPVLRLPDLNKMQVAAKISETRVSYIAPEMDAVVRVDAFPGMELKGRVTRVDEYPVPSGWFSQSVKQYATYVELIDPPPGVRPGLTAQVEINVERIPNALKAPVQAIFERNGEYYCVVRNGNRTEPRWLDIGPTNDQEVLIRNGLSEGEQVVLNPEPLIADVKLPPAPDGYWQTHPRYEALVRRAAQASPEKVGAAGGPPSPLAAGEAAPPTAAPGPARDPAARMQALLQRFDADGDGVISLDELPDEMRGRMTTFDRDGDGRLSQDELKSIPPRRNRPAEDSAAAAHTLQ